ncbi:MAG: GGGtGRT protein, partial [Clostridia bacterium]
MATFEGYDRRIKKLEGVLAEYGFADLDSMAQYVKDKGVDVGSIVRGVQPIAFDNAVWAYELGAAIALKKGCKNAADAAEAIGIGLQGFCIPGS